MTKHIGLATATTTKTRRCAPSRSARRGAKKSSRTWRLGSCIRLREFSSDVGVLVSRVVRTMVHFTPSTVGIDEAIKILRKRGIEVHDVRRTAG